MKDKKMQFARRFVGILLLSFVLSCSHSGTSTNNTNNNSEGTPPAPSSSSTVKTPPVGAGLLPPRGIDYGKIPQTIAFGSCADQDLPQPIWGPIVTAKPDLFIFMGDNVYASSPKQKPISEQYRKLAANADFRRARESIPFLATWDDHDYGQNDAGADNPEKEIAKREFLKFWPYVKESMILNQEGIFHAKMIGGTVKRRHKEPMLQIILLDTRTYRSPLLKVEDPEHPEHRFNPWQDKSKTILGQEQWAWLETQLQRPADLRIIISSIQLIAEGHGYEKWANFPHERQRFFDLLKSTKAHNVIVFSGDRHLSSIAKTEIPGWGTLYDITSSSLNRPSNLPDEADPSYQGPSFKGENFGLAKINWQKKRVTVEINDIEGKPVNGVEIKLK